MPVPSYLLFGMMQSTQIPQKGPPNASYQKHPDGRKTLKYLTWISIAPIFIILLFFSAF